MQMCVHMNGHVFVYVSINMRPVSMYVSVFGCECESVWTCVSVNGACVYVTVNVCKTVRALYVNVSACACAW